MKTKRGAMKRFRGTGTGKVKRSRAFKRHILSKKSAKRKMGLTGMTLVDKTNEKQVKRMLCMA
jgi:large subunit ribosomal protein L35